MKSMTELAGGELWLLQRPHNQLVAARSTRSGVLHVHRLTIVPLHLQSLGYGVAAADTILLQPVLPWTSSFVFLMSLMSRVTQSIHLCIGIPLFLLPGGTIGIVHFTITNKHACRQEHSTDRLFRTRPTTDFITSREGAPHNIIDGALHYAPPHQYTKCTKTQYITIKSKTNNNFSSTRKICTDYYRSRITVKVTPHMLSVESVKPIHVQQSSRMSTLKIVCTVTVSVLASPSDVVSTDMYAGACMHQSASVMVVIAADLRCGHGQYPEHVFIAESIQAEPLNQALVVSVVERVTPATTLPSSAPAPDAIATHMERLAVCFVAS